MRRWRKFKKQAQPYILFNLFGSMIFPVILLLIWPDFKLAFYHGDPFDFFFNYVFVSAGLCIIFSDRQMNANLSSDDHNRFNNIHSSFPAHEQRTDYVNNPTYSSMPGNNHYTSPFSSITSLDITKPHF